MTPFRSLIIKILLEHAIAAEEHAYALYEGLLESSPPAETARILKLLAAAELEHRIKLHELQEDPKAAAEALKTEETAAKPGSPAEADAGEGTVRREIRAPSEFRHILMTALEKERRAVRRYRRLADKSRLRTAKTVFSYLMRQEMEHENRILDLLGDTG